jgi:AraC-like DNA-binding protein
MRVVRSAESWCILFASGDECLCLNQLALRHGYRVTEMCLELACSRRYLHEVFVRDVGLSPKNWLRRERMQVAQDLLKGGRAVCEVASVLGFANSTNFRRELLECGVGIELLGC